MVMFDPHSLNHIIELGKSDAEKKAQDIANLIKN